MTTSRVLQIPAQRATEAKPGHKLRVLDQVRRLICQKKLPSNCMLVVQYLGEITDRKTGVAVVKLDTIAERIGLSRAAVARHLRKLIHEDVGLIKREPRALAGRSIANAYRLVDIRPKLTPAKPEVIPAGSPVNPRGVTGEPPYARTLNPFSRCLYPDGPANADRPQLSSPPEASTHERGPPPAFQNDKGAETIELDRDDWAEWLAREGRYRRFGPGPGEAYGLALDDLDRWRRDKGDGPILQALKRAKREKLYGDSLTDFMQNTWADGARSSRGGP